MRCPLHLSEHGLSLSLSMFMDMSVHCVGAAHAYVQSFVLQARSSIVPFLRLGAARASRVLLARWLD